MASIEYISFKLSKSIGDQWFSVSVSGEVGRYYYPYDTHFVGTLYSESFSDGFYLPDSDWDKIKEFTTTGKAEGTVYLSRPGQDYHDEHFEVECKLTLEKGTSIKEGHWIKLKYDFDLKPVLGNVDDLYLPRNITLSGKFPVKSPEKPKIYGYVKDENGNPISGARISSGGVNPAYTDGSGYYEYFVEPNGSYKLDVVKGGYNSTSEWVNVGTEDVRKDFVLAKEGEQPEDKSGYNVYGYLDNKWSLWHFYKNLSDAYALRDTLEADGTRVKIMRVDENGNETEKIYETEEVGENHNRIYGIVKDKALGTPINLAAVTFGGKTAYTRNDGKYEIKDVFASGQIVCSATGYKTATKFIEAPTEGDLEVNFELERSEAPQIDISPIAPPLQGMDKELSAANEIAKQQLDTAKTQGEIPEPAIETALRQVGLDDWADKYHEIYEWLNDNFGIEVPDPHDPTKKRKVIILTAGFAGGLRGLASKLGLNTAKGALTRAGGAIAATIGGLKASSILKGITGIVGTVVFAEFICEEAVQTAGMGVYMASQTKDPEVVRQALENYKNILNATKQIHDTVKYIDPIGSTFESFFVASENLSLIHIPSPRD
mgnify:CR=1 FL=1